MENPNGTSAGWFRRATTVVCSVGLPLPFLASSVFVTAQENPFTTNGASQSHNSGSSSCLWGSRQTMGLWVRYDATGARAGRRHGSHRRTTSLHVQHLHAAGLHLHLQGSRCHTPPGDRPGHRYRRRLAVLVPTRSTTYHASGGGGTTARAMTYDLDTGFVTSVTVDGVTTSFARRHGRPRAMCSPPPTPGSGSSLRAATANPAQRSHHLRVRRQQSQMDESTQGHGHLIRLLLGRGAAPNVRCGADHGSSTPLHEAVPSSTPWRSRSSSGLEQM